MKKVTYRNETSGKFGYFNSIDRVEKQVKGDAVVYTAYKNNGGMDILSYKEGEPTSKVRVWTVDSKGVKKALKPTPSASGRCILRRNNSQCHINEMIWQFEQMWRGLPPLDGEYNHHYPVVWQIKHYGYEIASVDGGSVCDRYINHKHYAILDKIYQDTGRQYSMSSDAANLVDWLISNKILYDESYEDILTTLETSGEIELIFKN